MTNTAKNRVRKRGVALVEAAIVAPVFAMLWLMMIHISGVYQYKIETAQESRYQAFYRATNSCTKNGSPPAGHTNGGADDSGGQTSSQTNDGSTDLSKGSSVPGSSAIMSNSKFIAKGTVTATWNYNSGASIEYTGSTYTVAAQDVKTDSYVLCNEEPSGINPISYLGGLASTITSNFPP